MAADRQCRRPAALQPGLAGGQGRGPSDAGPASHLVACRIAGHVAVRGRRDLGTAQGEPGLGGHRRHADGLSRLLLGLGQPPVDRPGGSCALGTLALTLATPGPVAGMALVLAYRAFPVVYDSPAMVVMAETLRTLPYRS